MFKCIPRFHSSSEMSMKLGYLEDARRRRSDHQCSTAIATPYQYRAIYHRSISAARKRNSLFTSEDAQERISKICTMVCEYCGTKPRSSLVIDGR